MSESFALLPFWTHTVEGGKGEGRGKGIRQLTNLQGSRPSASSWMHCCLPPRQIQCRWRPYQPAGLLLPAHRSPAGPAQCSASGRLSSAAAGAGCHTHQSALSRPSAQPIYVVPSMQPPAGDLHLVCHLYLLLRGLIVACIEMLPLHDASTYSHPMADPFLDKHVGRT